MTPSIGPERTIWHRTQRQREEGRDVTSANLVAFFSQSCSELFRLRIYLAMTSTARVPYLTLPPRRECLVGS